MDGRDVTDARPDFAELYILLTLEQHFNSKI